MPQLRKGIPHHNMPVYTGTLTLSKLPTALANLPEASKYLEGTNTQPTQPKPTRDVTRTPERKPKEGTTAAIKGLVF